MRVTILFVALIVGGYVVDDGHPLIGYALIGIAFWEAILQQFWNRGGQRGRVMVSRAFVCVFYGVILALAIMAALQRG